MLVHNKITMSVTVDDRARFHWTPRVEISRDCFICRRRGRTTVVEHGVDQGVCHSSRPLDDEVGLTGTAHAAPVRLSAFDTSRSRGGVHGVRAVVTSWWAPFVESGVPAATLDRWVRLHHSVGCQACFDGGEPTALHTPGARSVQTNRVWPSTVTCPTCDRVLLTAEAGPEVTVLD